eukprot:SAG22_NODE_7814_length_705_cov_1.018152_2_plen_73_part_00
MDPTERSSRYLAYNANTVDAKGLFILDKINGKPEEEIKAEIRLAVVNGMKHGKMIHFECQNTALPLGEYERG